MVLVTPFVVHLPILVHKVRVDVRNTSIQDILHKGTKPTVTTLTNDKDLTTLRKECSHISIRIAYYTNARCFRPTAKTAQATMNRTIVSNHMDISQVLDHFACRILIFQIMNHYTHISTPFLASLASVFIARKPHFSILPPKQITTDPSYYDSNCVRGSTYGNLGILDRK